MHSDQTIEKFRANYRSKISPSYNGYIHMGFVAIFGVSFIGFQFARVEQFHWYHGIEIAAVLVLWNIMEYSAHRRLGHQKKRMAAMFYKRHTGDHHSFFAETQLVPQSHKDWRVTLFPATLGIVMSIFASVVGACIGWLVGKDWGAVFAASLMLGYLSYEFFHFCDHLPSKHFLVRLPWIGHMRHLHKLHHRRDLMHSYNFNVTFPLVDWAFGTFYWIPPEQCPAEVD